jgi:hypothetical protein
MREEKFMDNQLIVLTFKPCDLSVSIKLDFSQNAQVINKLLDVLPYKSLVTHTIVSGGNVYHNTPIGNDFEFIPSSRSNRINAPIGTVFMSDLQTVFVKYADISETNDYPVIGKVINADIENLIHIGNLCWNSIYDNKEIILIEVKGLHNNSDKLKHIPVFNSLSENVDEALIQLSIDMRKALENIWIYPPNELKLIFGGKAKKKPGTNNQYFSAIVFVMSTLQQIAALGNTTLIAKIAQSNECSLSELKKLIKHLLPLHIFDFLGYCGLESYAKHAYEFLQLINSVKLKEDLFCLASIFAIYTNQMHLWSLHYFPWSEGEKYKY